MNESLTLGKRQFEKVDLRDTLMNFIDLVGSIFVWKIKKKRVKGKREAKKKQRMRREETKGFLFAFCFV